MITNIILWVNLVLNLPLLFVSVINSGELTHSGILLSFPPYYYPLYVCAPKGLTVCQSDETTGGELDYLYKS